MARDIPRSSLQILQLLQILQVHALQAPPKRSIRKTTKLEKRTS